jgi:hypothetical protein
MQCRDGGKYRGIGRDTGADSAEIEGNIRSDTIEKSSQR